VLNEKLEDGVAFSGPVPLGSTAATEEAERMMPKPPEAGLISISRDMLSVGITCPVTAALEYFFGFPDTARRLESSTDGIGLLVFDDAAKQGDQTFTAGLVGVMGLKGLPADSVTYLNLVSLYTGGDHFKSAAEHMEFGLFRDVYNLSKTGIRINGVHLHVEVRYSLDMTGYTAQIGHQPAGSKWPIPAARCLKGNLHLQNELYACDHTLEEGYLASGAFGRVPGAAFPKLKNNSNGRQQLAETTQGITERNLLRCEIEDVWPGQLHIWLRLAGHMIIALYMLYLATGAGGDALLALIRDYKVTVNVIAMGGAFVVSANGKDFNKFLVPGFWEGVLSGLADPLQRRVCLKIFEEVNEVWLLITHPETTSKDWLEIDTRAKCIGNSLAVTFGDKFIKPSIARLTIEFPLYIAGLETLRFLLGLERCPSPKSMAEGGAENKHHMTSGVLRTVGNTGMRPSAGGVEETTSPLQRFLLRADAKGKSMGATVKRLQAAFKGVARHQGWSLSIPGKPQEDEDAAKRRYGRRGLQGYGAPAPVAAVKPTWQPAAGEGSAAVAAVAGTGAGGAAASEGSGGAMDGDWSDDDVSEPEDSRSDDDDTEDYDSLAGSDNEERRDADDEEQRDEAFDDELADGAREFGLTVSDDPPEASEEDLMELQSVALVTVDVSTATAFAAKGLAEKTYDGGKIGLGPGAGAALVLGQSKNSVVKVLNKAASQTLMLQLHLTGERRGYRCAWLLKHIESVQVITHLTPKKYQEIIVTTTEPPVWMRQQEKPPKKGEKPVEASARDFDWHDTAVQAFSSCDSDCRVWTVAGVSEVSLSKPLTALRRLRPDLVSDISTSEGVDTGRRYSVDSAGPDAVIERVVGLMPGVIPLLTHPASTEHFVNRFFANRTEYLTKLRTLELPPAHRDELVSKEYRKQYYWRLKDTRAAWERRVAAEAPAVIGHRAAAPVERDGDDADEEEEEDEGPGDGLRAAAERIAAFDKNAMVC